MTEFRIWLQWAFPLKGKISQGTLLDPFSTSLRSTKMTVERLYEVASRGNVGGSDPIQAMADVRSFGLAVGTQSAAALTAFGADVLREWEHLGVANSDPEYEIARCGVLVRTGVQQGVDLYLRMFNAWKRRVELQPADYWLEDRWHLFASSYLDKTSDSGYNAFEVLCAVNGGIIGEADEWENFASSHPALAPHIRLFVQRVNGQREAQRASFCKAMELYRLTASPGRAVADQIIRWR